MSRNILDSTTGLTTRQRNLLFAVIKEYCEYGKNIGSKELKEKYGFTMSPATIRNEFARLRDLGYLYQPFTNSSSQPTEKAFKLFINQLIVALNVTSRQQQDLKRKIVEMDQTQLNLNKQITKLLALQAGGIGFTVDQHKENISGMGNLLAEPGEGKVSQLLEFLDNLDNYKTYLLEHKEPKTDEIITVESKKPGRKSRKKNLRTIFGYDNPVLPLGHGYAMVATEVMLDNQKTVVGLITPTRLLANKKNLELMDALSKVLNNDPEDDEI